jgi:hypothetical protein
MTTPTDDKKTILDAETEEAKARLRIAFNHIDRAIDAIRRVNDINQGSPETSLSLRRLQEGRFWLIEHGHGSWVES